MRLFQIIFYIIAFTIGGCFAFQRNVQFPYRTPKSIKLVQPAIPTSDSFPGVSARSPKDDRYNSGILLFKSNCATCHNRNMKDDLTGPALGGVKSRWSAYPEEDLYRWIRNAPAMVDEGHPYGKKLWQDWNKTIMPSFSNLSDEDISDLLYYVEETNR